MSTAKYKVYLHQDTFILEQDFLFKLLDIFADARIGLVGMIGAESLPRSGLWWESRSTIGKVWEFRRGNRFFGMFYGPRKKRLTEGRKHVVPPWSRAIVIDGLLMATQDDVPWREDLDFGFIYYEASQCLEFIKAGHLVVVPYQEQPWCIHYGNIKERSPEQQAVRRLSLQRNLTLFREEYKALLAEHHRASERDRAS